MRMLSRSSALRGARQTIKKLDRHGWRTLLGLSASAWLTTSLGTPVFLHWKQGAWRYRWRGATLAHPTLGSALHPEQARRVFTFIYTPRPGDVVFDVGAGFGDSTLLFSKLVGESGKVVAIEAHPDTYGWLIRLCDVNRLANVVALQLAASNQEGEIFISDTDGLTNTVLESDATMARVTVRARCLDTVADELAIEKIDFLKMNIEGAEREALNGMARIIERTHSVCVSCHDFMADRGGPDTMRTRAFVVAFLRERGFSVTAREASDEVARSYVYGMNKRWSD
jgi:FkbM family methyltransferase